MINLNAKTFKRSIAAIAVSAVLGVSPVTMAANNDGAVTGVVATESNVQLAGAEIRIKNKQTGLTRTVTADENGSYRFPHLPTGLYTITAKLSGYETSVVDTVQVSLGSTTSVGVVMTSGNIERISVVGSAVSSIDVTSSEVALNIGAVEISRMPVQRNVNAVALLAPGTTTGDSRFNNGDSISFGGASPAENSTYINGLNVTNFRNGLGFSTVPYSFYKEFQIKTGGYSAEFGRATGGVVNAVTKSGTNEFKFGGELVWTPDFLRGEGQNTRYPDGRLYRVNSEDKKDRLNGSVYASGPIIKDTLFFYAMYEARDYQSDYSGSTGDSFVKYSNDNDFWGAKIDWNITENHTLEFLAFSDSNDGVYDNYGYDFNTKKLGSFESQDTEERGGDNWSVSYTGYLTDDLTMKALYGENKYKQTDRSDVQDICNAVYDDRADAPSLRIGCIPSAGIEQGEDTREAFRLDFEYALDDHLIRFGYDLETNTSEVFEAYAGPSSIAPGADFSTSGVYYDIYDVTESRELPNGFTVPEGIDAYVEVRERRVGGAFETEQSAFYIEDTWYATDELTLSLGVRLETFDNRNSDGKSFVKIDDMIAPRLGFSWDVNGDGDSKLYGNVGRYFLPVANNTNVRLSGNEYDRTDYYVFEGLSNETLPNGTQYQLPIIGEKLGGPRQPADGNVPDTSAIVDADLDPMYQDEIILGYQSVINDEFSWGIKGIMRSLNGAIDDMYLGDNGYGCYHGDYVLGNPGEDALVLTPTSCVEGQDPVLEMKNISTSALGYPKAERKYSAIEVNLDRAWDDVWSMHASYIWSHSYGNSEGLVKSDNGQDDAGLTTDFDFAELMDGAYGNLPNDRRHQIRLRGAYALTEELTLGLNMRIESGRPQTYFGVDHPDGRPDYGRTYWIVDSNGNYVKSTRGSAGETPWTFNLDLSARYVMELEGGSNLTFRVDVFNLLDAHSVTYSEERTNVGSFGLARAYQEPRSVQLTASYDF